ncbi:uncharacterized protein Z520_10691 [Fonsecaea multimorphosa CBS 102226]|uniref:Uncharacterized protein n=1 Tax=Fonsecaea multimorphosa CBS 102226 TaxID=1442371 RepID=A0A0D2KAM3_9EURO|nr:uncharacterized protein Z520_10691 [Fonsecaea multimorphosa CBS 102226]KIX93513.1 hypothetical protein Z520_10691 [Fonsecaea multimorphosa CBS 102226]
MLAYLMENEAYEKREVLNMVIDRGVDLAKVLNLSPHGRHTILLVLYATGPRAFAHDFVRQHIGLFEYYDMAPANSWLIRTIARSESWFRSKLIREHQDLWNPSCGDQAQKAGPDVSLQTQINDMRMADSEERNLYLSALCAGGTAAELDALLSYPSELPELDPSHDNGNCLRQYLEISASFGNCDVFERLVKAGADVTTDQDLLWRLTLGVPMVPAYFNKSVDWAKSRCDMVGSLLLDPSTSLSSCLPSLITNLRPSKTVRAALWLSDHLNITSEVRPQLNPDEALIWSKFGHVISYTWPRLYKIQSLKLKRGMEGDTGVGFLLTAAVLLRDQKVLETVLTEVADLEWEDINGLTALMLAIISRSFESARTLLLHGADAQGMKSCGFSAKQLIIKLRDLCEDREAGNGSDRRCNDVLLRDKHLRQRICEEFGEKVGYFSLDVCALDSDLRGSFKEFNDAIEMLGFDNCEQEQVSTIPQSVPKTLETTSMRLKPEPLTIHLLVIAGYVIGILAHVGYDTWYSLSWLSKLPPSVLALEDGGEVLVLVYAQRDMLDRHCDWDDICLDKVSLKKRVSPPQQQRFGKTSEVFQLKRYWWNKYSVLGASEHATFNLPAPCAKLRLSNTYRRAHYAQLILCSMHALLLCFIRNTTKFGRIC